MQLNNEVNVRPSVIVRAWGDEPVKLTLHRIENKRCYVGNERTLCPIGLPFDQVFAFDVDRFASLCTAFTQKDISSLAKLWAGIPVDDFACNKYQDVLGSSHDQENITDPECTENRHR